MLWHAENREDHLLSIGSFQRDAERCVIILFTWMKRFCRIYQAIGCAQCVAQPRTLSRFRRKRLLALLLIRGMALGQIP